MSQHGWARLARADRGPAVGGALRRSLGLLTLCVILAVPALAADDNKVIYPGGGTRPETPAAAAGSTANALTLVVALALAGAGGWLFWRNRRAPGIGRDGRALAIEETRSLGNRQYLVVASYEGRKFLLGVCPGRIDLLSPLDERRLPEDPK